MRGKRTLCFKWTIVGQWEEAQLDSSSCRVVVNLLGFLPFPFTRSERFYEEWALLLVHSHKLRVTRTKGAANWINCLWATRRTDPILIIISANCRKTTECRHNKQRNFTLYAIWGILSKLSFSEIVW